MLIAGAVCPHPPLLIPDAAGAEPPGAFRKLLASSDLALRTLTATVPDLIAVIGGGPETREYPPGAAGGLQDYGIDVTVGTGEPVLPLSLTVGRWLLLRAGCDGSGPPVLVQAVSQRATPAECRALGAAIAARAPRVAVLALGDGSARRARDIEGAPDPDAQDYDDEVAEALAAADARWLGQLDPAMDDRFLVAGRAAWQVLAGAAAGRRMQGRLHCCMAPYGVSYLVASWDSLDVLADSGTAGQAGPGRPVG
jgi:hypothetical protein